jgi:all-trans-8'-apo-beta-carotenal 15,15'-oxygenase
VLPRSVYIHDWFATERHLIFLLHPGFITLGGYVKLLAGAATFAESVRWRPEEGNLIAVVARDGNDPPKLFETDALWMWHSANAFEKGNELVLDFVGDAVGGGIGTDDSGFYHIMSGKEPAVDPHPTSFLFRYVLDVDKGTCRRETLADGWNFEMPFLDPAARGNAHQNVYLARADEGQLFWSAIVRHDVATGAQSAFHFGDGNYCTEPVFLPSGSGRPDDGWLASVVYEHRRRQSHVAILDASHLEDGPLARVRLRHALPLSFHGCFSPRRGG